MDILTALSRAKRGLRDDLSLYVIAVVSLLVAFLCLGVTLLTLTNLNRISKRWNQTHNISVYLANNSDKNDISQLQLVLESLPEIQEIDYFDSLTAKKKFLEQYDSLSDLNSLPAEVFPTSLEIKLAHGVDETRLAAIVQRLKGFAQVTDVETYSDWFKHLASLLNVGQFIALALTLLVTVCVVAVIGNTIRLAIANRSIEIEVLKLCGASNGYVKMPFIVEGALQGLLAALLSLLILLIAYAILRGQLESTLVTLSGVSITFLSPTVSLAIVLGGTAAGAIGSLLSLRHYLSI